MPYSDEQVDRLFTALGYARRIETQCFGELEYPRPEVREFHRSKARIKVALAPARTSKSFAGSWDMIPDILDFDRPEKHLIVGPDYDKASKEFNYVADALVHRRDEAKRKYGLVIPEPVQYYNTPKTGRMQIVWPWGAELHAKSAAHFSSVIGESWGVALLSETCELGPEVFYRALRTRCRRFIMPTTPGLKGMWVKSLYERSNEVGEKDVEVFRFPPEANPTYDMERFKAELRRVGDKDPYFREQFLGEWVFYGGRVFPMFQPEPVERVTRWQIKKGGIAGGEGRVCIDMDPLEIPESWKRVAGADFGFRDKTVYLWGAVAPDGTVIIYDEYYQAQRSIREHAEGIWAKMRANGTKRIDDCVREPKGQALQISHDFSREFGIWSRPATSADRLSSRLHMQAYLEPRPEDGCPSLRIIKRQCPNLVRELLGLHYEDEDPETRREGKTEVWRGEDHAVDACFVAGTAVQTEHGERPIESVRVGDRVWTRRGLRYVTAAGCTGVRDTRIVTFHDGRELRGTPDHPIWNHDLNGWTRLDALSYSLCVSWYTKDEPTAKFTNETTSEITGSFSTARSGNESAGPSRQTITSTTAMETRETTNSRILSVFRRLNIFQNTGGPSLAFASTLNEFARWLLSGTPHRLVLSGTRVMPEKRGNRGWPWSAAARFVGLRSELHSHRPPDSAGTTANPPFDVKVASMTRIACARLVERLSAVVATPPSVPVLGRVRSRFEVSPSDPAKVYNLTVDGEHEYFANGVLVSNCRYLLSTRPSPRHKVDEVDKYWNSLNELKRNRRRLARKYDQIGWKPAGGWNGPA